MGEFFGVVLCGGLPIAFLIYAFVKLADWGRVTEQLRARLDAHDVDMHQLRALERQLTQLRADQARNAATLAQFEQLIAELQATEGVAPTAPASGSAESAPAAVMSTPIVAPVPTAAAEPARVLTAPVASELPKVEEVDDPWRAALAAASSAQVADAAPLPEAEPVVAPTTPDSTAEPPVQPVQSAQPAQPARPAQPAQPLYPDADEAALTAKVDWEAWLGVRGAALMGGIVMAVAGIMFFRYAIEHSLIAPPIRVALSLATGIACLTAGERLRPRYTPTANALSAGGVVVLFAAFWASHSLYALVPMFVAFALMALTTAVCALLAVRYESQVVAVLGICGGFATPLLLSSGGNRPFGLFGYVLLLDLGFLYVARRRGWTLLANLLLGLTALMQFLWIWKRMEADQLPLALAILGVFALLFAWTAGKAPAEQREGWWPSQAVALVLPFLFVQHFAGQAELGPHLYPVALLMALLLAGAGYVGEQHRNQAVSMFASAATVAVLVRYLFAHPLDAALGWELALCVAGLAAVPQIFVERNRDSVAWDGPMGTALVAQLGLHAVYSAALLLQHDLPLWSSAAGWALLTALLLWHGRLPGRELLYVGAPVALALALAAFEYPHRAWPGFGWLEPRGLLVHHGGTFLLNSLLALALQVFALRVRAEPHRQRAEQASALVPLIWIVAAPAWFTVQSAPLFALGLTFGWAYLAVLTASRLGSGLLYAAPMLALGFAHFCWTDGFGTTAPRTGLCAQGASALFFMVWPTLRLARLSGERFAWYAAALAGPLWFMSLRQLWLASFGAGTIGVLPVLLAAATLGVLMQVQRLLARDDPQRLDTLAWLAAVALGFVSVAIPLQVDRQWITLGWALEGFAVIALWARLDHAGLKFFGLSLLGAVFVRLVFNDAVLSYEPRASLRIFNWLMYTYWVPVGAMLGASRILARLEHGRLRAWEESAIGAALTGFGAVVLFFAWINLTIADWFSSGDAVTLSFEHSPGRDLVTSLAWACYAVLLLAVGMWRQLGGLRWLSLGFLLLTIGKVFLYDLSHLHDLYRIMSLVGLAFSLLGVSLAYQRFVFRKASDPGDKR
jgi:uncharacterized membrane protein